LRLAGIGWLCVEGRGQVSIPRLFFGLLFSVTTSGITGSDPGRRHRYFEISVGAAGHGLAPKGSVGGFARVLLSCMGRDVADDGQRFLSRNLRFGIVLAMFF